MKSLGVVLAMILFVGTAFSADLNGKWMAQVTSPSGSNMERIFTFQVADSKLSGTVLSQSVALATFEEPGKPIMSGTLKTQMGNPQAISEAKISGDDFSFVTVSNMMGNEVKTIYKGKVSASEIKFTVETKFPAGMTGPGGSPMTARPAEEIVAKRVGL